MSVATLQDLVRETHPHRLMEPLDTTALNDLSLALPTVIIEVVGAREGIDALVRVRRVAADAPVAAVRVAAAEMLFSDPHSRPMANLVAVGCAALVLAAALLVAIRPTADKATALAAAAVAATVLVVGAVRAVIAVRRTRGAPMRRRRHFERRRCISVIAVSSVDERSAISLASSVRRELDNTHVGDGRIEVSVFDPLAEHHGT